MGCTKARNILLIVFCLQLGVREVSAQVYYPGTQPGKAISSSGKNRLEIRNAVLAIELVLMNNQIEAIFFQNLDSKQKLAFPKSSLFELSFEGGTSLSFNQFTIKDAPRFLKGRDQKGQFIELSVLLRHPSPATNVDWRIKLYDDVNYVLHQFTIQAARKAEKFSALVISDGDQPKITGIVSGSPVEVGNNFFALENPMFEAEKKKEGLLLTVRPFSDLGEQHRYTETMVWGCTPAGQLRRAFLFYLEHRRPTPYHPYTYYDTWYDLSYGLNVLTEENCINRIKVWGDSLAKRGTRLDCFLWDSGWDDWHNMWAFNKKLPDRFSNLNREAKKYNARSGAWLSPWGGYDEFIVERLASAREKFPQYKITGKGFTLTDSLYYNYFEQTILDLIRYDHVSLFKIDGVGAGKDANSAGDHDEEMNLFIRMMKNIRKEDPAVRLNLTVGTWPSPFWLFIGDNIWKGGEDYGVSAEGNKRQQWMNFRDAGVYNCLKRSPLCPVSSLMFHGVTVANYGATATYEMDDTYIADDIWTFFGNGSSLQELYINPHKLSPAMWDELAKAIQWSHQKKGILVDSHWVGGDPSKGEVYGFASWNPEGGTLLLRNPSSSNIVFDAKPGDLLDLPGKFKGSFQLYDVRLERLDKVVSSHAIEHFSLKPFEVKIFELHPEVKK